MRHKKSVMRNMMMVTQLGLSVMVPVFVCILAGSWIDRHAGTNLTIFLMFLGFLAGGWNGYKVAMTTLKMNEQEEKKDNLINTFDALLEMGAIPIVNENDSVSYTEIESNDRLFGDNDMLSSVVAVLCRASKLVIFSDIDGFYNCDPRLHPDAKLIEEIDKIDDEVYKLAGGAGSRRGTGGMRTKLQAAALATSQGIDTIITNGKNPAALYDIIEGVPVGTKFKAQ